MIQANELRIGNLIAVPECGIAVPVTELKINSFTADMRNVDFDGVETSFPYESGEPIPLTPAIFEKAGFKWEGGSRKGWFTPMVNDWKMRIWQTDEHDFVWSINDFNAINLFHLHTLQNLYFALTGQELTITL